MVATFSDMPRRRFEAQEVLRMVELGVLDEDEHIELLDGELVIVPPQGPIHASLTVVVHNELQRAYGTAAHVRDHSPIDASRYSMPEPDVAVVRGDPRDYMTGHPAFADLLLVVEIAYTSHSIDRRKGRIYAAAGVAEYWLLDVPSRRLERRTRPAPAGEYGCVELFDDDASVALPGLDVRLELERLLPPRA